MDIITTPDERRAFKRFSLHEGTSFISCPDWLDKGELVNIGKGGLAFNYNSETPWSDCPVEGFEVCGKQTSSLNNFPMTVVADHPIKCDHGNTMFVRRRSYKFGELNLHQKFLLECFVWINSTAQC